MVNFITKNIDETIECHVFLYRLLPDAICKNHLTLNRDDNISCHINSFVKGLKSLTPKTLELIFKKGVNELCVKGFSPLDAINHFNHYIRMLLKLK